MFIAFEGPDKTGKSTSANELSTEGESIYNATKEKHATLQAMDLSNSVVTYDRIDWFSHMVYRLALPEHEWNDERPRTVFAMPDTHLVIKHHHPQFASDVEDELYELGTVSRASSMYKQIGEQFLQLNFWRNFALFKTVSLLEIKNDPRTGGFYQYMVGFSSPVLTLTSRNMSDIDSNQKLLNLLNYEEKTRLS